MADAIFIPFEVFGLGFVIAICIAAFMKLLMNAIRYFSKDAKRVEG